MTSETASRPAARELARPLGFLVRRPRLVFDLHQRGAHLGRGGRDLIELVGLLARVVRDLRGRVVDAADLVGHLLRGARHAADDLPKGLGHRVGRPGQVAEIAGRFAVDRRQVEPAAGDVALLARDPADRARDRLDHDERCGCCEHKAERGQAEHPGLQRLARRGRGVRLVLVHRLGPVDVRVDLAQPAGQQRAGLGGQELAGFIGPARPPELDHLSDHRLGFHVGLPDRVEQGLLFRGDIAGLRDRDSELFFSFGVRLGEVLDLLNNGDKRGVALDEDHITQRDRPVVHTAAEGDAAVLAGQKRLVRHALLQGFHQPDAAAGDHGDQQDHAPEPNNKLRPNRLI